MPDLATKYAIPPEVMMFVDEAFLEVVSEDEAQKTVEFHVPARRWEDGEGRVTSYSLTWIHPAFNAEFCAYFDEKPGDLPNFHVTEDTTDIGDEIVDDIRSVDDLVWWLNGARTAVKRSKAGKSMFPSAEELAAVFSRILNDWLPPETIAEVNRRNALPENRGGCASHDFCDSNQAMIDALRSFGVEFSAALELRAITEAWNLAKARGFATEPDRK